TACYIHSYCLSFFVFGFVMFILLCIPTGTSNSYILFTQAKTWYEAQKYCRTYYKDLASVRNQTENDQIKNMIQGSGVIWIGLFRDSWKWSDGNNVSFHIWNSGQPDNEYGNDENCAVALLNQLANITLKWRQQPHGEVFQKKYNGCKEV
uniref:C-type lectin domain-containing protein n=1 Tax=Electrophorus electricus TaxID=8005 RepID=A0A4W4ETW3_ELEEL